VLIVWRKLTGDLGKDNLPNLQQEGDTWKVRLTEEEFMKRMWDVEV
jgi:adenine-specific DNA-methyltransferase